jgi:hypothetical protein
MRVRVSFVGLLLALGVCAGCDSSSGGSSRVAFVPNSFAFWDDPDNWTTPYGPAYADIVPAPSYFVPCAGGPIALCYYSGASPETCTLTDDGRFANCKCFEIPYGPYFVLMDSILNYAVYEDTVRVCGADGSICSGQANLAPVCDVINRGKLIPGADVISTFSFACAPEEGIGQTPCTAAPYAGCMTAPCWRQNGELICQCPVFDGPYQVGNFNAQCDLASDLVWSAAYNPTEEGGTAPDPPSCVPDAPGDYGCPLLGPPPYPPPAAGCDLVCSQYRNCTNSQGVQIGFTCDATLCTSSCTDQDLVQDACTGLSSCDVSAILALEAAEGCSCCASQLCGCQANGATNAELVRLNTAQAARGIESQCEVNGTLCGE